MSYKENDLNGVWKKKQSQIIKYFFIIYNVITKAVYYLNEYCIRQIFSFFIEGVTDLLLWEAITISRTSRMIYKKVNIFHKLNTVTYFAFGIDFNRLLPLKALLLILIVIWYKKLGLSTTSNCECNNFTRTLVGNAIFNKVTD